MGFNFLSSQLPPVLGPVAAARASAFWVDAIDPVRPLVSVAFFSMVAAQGRQHRTCVRQWIVVECNVNLLIAIELIPHGERRAIYIPLLTAPGPWIQIIRLGPEPYLTVPAGDLRPARSWSRRIWSRRIWSRRIWSRVARQCAANHSPTWAALCSIRKLKCFV